MKRREEEARCAALYARVSTEAQFEEGYSLDAQKEMLEAYCKSRQIQEYEFFVDGGFSGSSLERPGMQRLIEAVRQGRISSVVVYKLDRLSRSQKDTLFLIEDVFNPNRTDFVSLNENMDTATPIGRAMLGIMSAFAQLERETIRERTRMGMRERVRSGRWMGGGKVPFGYDYDREKGILVPNADAPTVRKIYELYLQGWSLMAISQKLGLKYERLAEQILLRKTNTGVIVYNGEEYPAAHEAIVPAELYDAALTLYHSRQRADLRPARSLLAGLVVCGVCGAKMRYQKWGKSGYRIYCYSQDKGKPHLSHGACDNIRMDAAELEGAVLEDLFSIASEDVPEEAEKGDASGKKEPLAVVLERQAAALEKKLKKLYNLYAASEDDTLLEVIGENKRELERLRGETQAAREKQLDESEKQQRQSEIRNLRDAWAYMDLREQQAVLRRVIEKIVVTYEKVEIFYAW